MRADMHMYLTAFSITPTDLRAEIAHAPAQSKAIIDIKSVVCARTFKFDVCARTFKSDVCARTFKFDVCARTCAVILRHQV
jgi:hypothetical protein